MNTNQRWTTNVDTMLLDTTMYSYQLLNLL